jgi:hypothetical protein
LAWGELVDGNLESALRLGLGDKLQRIRWDLAGIGLHQDDKDVPRCRIETEGSIQSGAHTTGECCAVGKGNPKAFLKVGKPIAVGIW